MKKIIISGLSGGSGKTILSLGLARFFTQQGHPVFPFKKGPDYIDSAWLMQACHRPCYCLDPFFMNENELSAHFHGVMQNAPQNGLALIEGNRGLYDGKDQFGSCSTANLAHTLDCPVLLAINCTKMTRTTAALVMGIQNFDPKLKLGGVILNNIASGRHAGIIQKSIEEYTDVPVLGIIPRQSDNPIPERHLGLSLKDFPDKDSILDRLADIVRENTDTEKILSAAAEENSGHTVPCTETKQHPLNIAYLYDDAFWFYYQENFDALNAEGANLVPLSLLDGKSFDGQLKQYGLNENDIDGLYLGGGYPELYAEQISASPKLKTIKNWIDNEMPVYAECGGFMLLTKNLLFPENGTLRSYAMAGVFGVDTEFHPKPQGLGYTEAAAVCENPFHPVGKTWKGHEFHFSAAANCPKNQNFVLRLTKGRGMGQKISEENGCAADGLAYKNCFASYTHLFAPAVPHFAANFVNKAREFHRSRHGGTKEKQ